MCLGVVIIGLAVFLMLVAACSNSSAYSYGKPTGRAQPPPPKTVTCSNCGYDYPLRQKGMSCPKCKAVEL